MCDTNQIHVCRPFAKRKPYLDTPVESSTYGNEQTGRLDEPQVISTTDKVSPFAEVAEMIQVQKVLHFDFFKNTFS